MENRVLTKLCSAAPHVILLWALHPTHSTSLVQEDPIGGPWRPSSPSRNHSKAPPLFYGQRSSAEATRQGGI